MKTKHAPGPWEARREMGDWIIRRAGVIYANDAVKIADVNHGRMDDEANAALIAASPVLYAFVVDLARNGNASAKSTLASLNLTY